MELITRITKAELIRRYSSKGLTKHSFDHFAQLLGFNTYPGKRGVLYGEEDVVAKMNLTTDKLSKKLLRERA